jgi:hypothetical protein
MVFQLWIRVGRLSLGNMQRENTNAKKQTVQLDSQIRHIKKPFC